MLLEDNEQCHNEATEFAITDQSSSTLTKEASSKRQYFQHTPLDLASPSIRLLEVLPGRGNNGRVACRLQHTTTAATYTCLSYEWGDRLKKHYVTVDGELFAVGENLYRFLRVASSRKIRCSKLPLASSAQGPKTLDVDVAMQAIWIDALCIDQDNVSERNHQVQQMGTIYRGASQLIIWLGAGNVDFPPLLNHMQQRYLAGCANEDDLTSDCIRWFNRHSYWTRAWVTQEVVLSKEAFVLSGHTAFDLTEVHHTLCAPSQVSRGLCDKSWQTLIAMRSSLLSSQVPVFTPTGFRKPLVYNGTLLQNLALFGDKTCYVALDKIFSLLSISTDGHKVKVDYRIRIADLAKKLMAECGNRFCLCQAYTVLAALQLQTANSYGSFASFQPIKMISNDCRICSVALHLPRDSPFFLRKWVCCFRCEHYDDSGRRWWNNFGHIVILERDSGNDKIYWILPSGDVDKYLFLQPSQRKRTSLRYASDDTWTYDTTPILQMELKELLVLAGVSRTKPFSEMGVSMSYRVEVPLDDKAHGLLRVDTMSPSIHGWSFPSQVAEETEQTSLQRATAQS